MLKSGRGGSRPNSGRKKSDDPLRSRSIRFTDTEWLQLKANAKAANCTISEYIRRLALSTEC